MLTQQCSRGLPAERSAALPPSEEIICPRRQRGKLLVSLRNVSENEIPLAGTEIPFDISLAWSALPQSVHFLFGNIIY